MVQPWSRNFSTDLDHPDKIVVWARLPGLPYRYYMKIMFRYIAGVIGRIVKIDYNTPEGKRGRFTRLAVVVELNKPLVPRILIDGVYQKVEYEGLPTICYSCGRYGHSDDVCKKFMAKEYSKQRVDSSTFLSAPPKDRFGPWMQVSSRRLRKVSESKKMNTLASPKHGFFKATGSSFDMLVDDTYDNIPRDRDTDHVAAGTGDALLNVLKNVIADGGLGNGVVDLGSVHESILVVIEINGSEKRVQLRGSGSDAPRTCVTVKASSHIAVRVVERGADLGSKKGGDPARMKQPSRQPSKVGLDEWVGSFDRELEDSMKGQRSPSLGSDQQVAETLDVKWRENVSFDGADFDRFLCLFLSSHKRDILVLLELRVSGRKSDMFITCHGFPSSYRVEANGFSGGIWLLWKHSVSIDVLAVSNQYIHASCMDNYARRSFLLTYVYASATKRKRDELWDQLIALKSSGNTTWVLGGDFNSILSFEERMGGSYRRDGVSTQFCDFMRCSDLNDLGFQGPRFIWKHGTLHQRLDRCLGNDEWWNLWPSSQVMHLGRLGSDHRSILLVTESLVAAKRNSSFKYPVSWQSHGGFEEMFVGNWNSNLPIVENIANFQTAACRWNQESFGHIGKRKRSLLARIRGIECANESSVVSFLGGLEEKLKYNLDEVSFVPGHCIMDNVIVTREDIHSMRFKSGKKWWMAIKVDLEKAYNRLELCFIEDMLIDLGPANWIRLIMECISTVTMHVLWNGELTDQFQPSRGLRLSQAIEIQIANRSWKEIHLSRNGMGLSHLFFADDLVFFVEATTQQMRVIRTVLHDFCDASGHRARLVLQAIPSYTMQVTWIPKRVCLEIEKLIHIFIWGDSTDHKMVYLVRWDEVSRPTQDGGLGFRHLDYYKWDGSILACLRQGRCSRLWMGITRVWDAVRQGLIWSVRDGKSVGFCMKPKLVVVFVAMMLVSYSCMASPRRAMLGGLYGQQQRHQVGKAKSVEAGTRNTVEKNTDNHHNIPRQKYDGWGNNSPDSGDNGDDGNG
ncbi:hypothetical protein GQ457_06G008600 [Hibiscus cannabinus]